MSRVLLFSFILFALLLRFELDARLLQIKNYSKIEEIKYILKRSMILIGLKTRKRIIQLMPLESSAFFDTQKIQTRSFKVRAVIGKTACHVFEGACYLSNITDVSIINIHAERDEKGWLDILTIHEGKKKIYEYVD